MKKDPLRERLEKREPCFRGKYLSVERLYLRLNDGHKAVREVVKVQDAVAVLPMDENNQVYLVRQHRPAIGRTILEVPAGVLSRGETPQSCGRRECQEETGMRPSKLRKLASYAHAEGYSTGFITLYLGTQLKKSDRLNLDPTEHLVVVRMPFQKLLQKIKQEKIIDSKTILSTLLSRKYFRKKRKAGSR